MITEKTDMQRREARLEFLNREAAEVYLLIDYLSGQADQTFAESPRDARRLAQKRLDLPPEGDGPHPWATLDIEETLHDPTLLVERAMAIKYPLTEGSENFEADAAFLLRARAELNRRAAPATGLSVAFTSMVFHERLTSGRSGPIGVKEHPKPAATNHPNAEVPSIYYSPAAFAYEAFPWLRLPAYRFARSIRRIVAFAFILLVATLVLSACMAWGTVLLNTFDAIRHDFGAIKDEIKTLESNGKLSHVAAGSIRAADGSNFDRNDATWSLLDNLINRICSAPHLYEFASTPSGTTSGQTGDGYRPTGSMSESSNSDQYRVCDDLFMIRERVLRVRYHLNAWAGWLPQHPTVDEQWGPAALSVFGNYVVPIMYGLLGSMAFILRRFQDRLAGSLLMPRDHQANNIRLALGALIGACIGLFYTGSASVSQEKGLLGIAITLSAAALAFLAGYAVEVVFRTLDALMFHVFRINELEKKTK